MRLVTAGNCSIDGVSTAIYTRHPGLGTRVPRVRHALTAIVNVSRSSVSVGTAAARGLNFANERRNVSTCTAILVIGRWCCTRVVPAGFGRPLV